MSKRLVAKCGEFKELEKDLSNLGEKEILAIEKDVRRRLRPFEDAKRAKFAASLCPTLDPAMFLGPRMGDVKKIARDFRKEDPHRALMYVLGARKPTMDEIMIHEEIVMATKDPILCANLVESSLHLLMDWMSVDHFVPEVFKKEREVAEKLAVGFMNSTRVYEKRMGMRYLHALFLLGPNGMEWHEPHHTRLIAATRSPNYYLQMMAAWYMATLMAKFPEEAMAIMEAEELQDIVHNMTIRKSIESYVVDGKIKEKLKGMKRPVISESVKE